MIADSPEQARSTPSARRRVLWCVCLGVLAGVPVALFVDVFGGIGVGWIVAAAAWLVRTWVEIAPLDASGTQQHAGCKDPGRRTSHVVLLFAAVASLAAVVFAVGRAAAEPDPLAAALLAALGIGMVVASWALVHTLYTLRYALLYTDAATDMPHPIDFNTDDAPDYLDFAYFAFTVGMTYQVSDTNVSDRRIRRATLGQALLSFLFGTVVLATTINLIASLSTPGI